MSYLSSRRIREQIYNFLTVLLHRSGSKKSCYCVNPNDKGVPQDRRGGRKHQVSGDLKRRNPKVTGIIAKRLSNRGLSELGL